MPQIKKIGGNVISDGELCRHKGLAKRNPLEGEGWGRGDFGQKKCC